MSILVTGAPGETGRRPAPRHLVDQSPKPSGIELVSEMSGLAAGAGMLLFVLAPLALPALALAAVATVVLLIPPIVGAILTAPILLLRRWWQPRKYMFAAETLCDDRASGASNARACVAVEGRPTIRDAA